MFYDVEEVEKNVCENRRKMSVTYKTTKYNKILKGWRQINDFYFSIFLILHTQIFLIFLNSSFFYLALLRFLREHIKKLTIQFSLIFPYKGSIENYSPLYNNIEVGHARCAVSIRTTSLRHHRRCRTEAIIHFSIEDTYENLGNIWMRAMPIKIPISAWWREVHWKFFTHSSSRARSVRRRKCDSCFCVIWIACMLHICWIETLQGWKFLMWIRKTFKVFPAFIRYESHCWANGLHFVRTIVVKWEKNPKNPENKILRLKFTQTNFSFLRFLKTLII
jgi:hypothetical protein